MPFYQLVCRACGRPFEQQASIRERTERRIACPDCGSREVETDYSAGSAAVRVNKSEPLCPHGGSCDCGGCAAARR